MNKVSAIALAVFLTGYVPGVAQSQQSVDSDPEMPGIQQPVSPVKVDGKVLFTVRGFSGYTAEQRSAAVSKRIREAASDKTIPADSVKVKYMEEYSMVYAGQKFIMNVYDQDAVIETVSRATLADLIKKKTEEAIISFRNSRSPGMIIKRTIYAAGILIVMSIVIFVLRWIFRKIDLWIQKKIKSRIDKVENVSFSLIRSQQLWATYHMTFRILRSILYLILIVFSLEYILGVLPWTSNISRYVLSLIIDPLTSMGNGILSSIPELIFLVLLYFVTRYLIKIFRLMFTGIQQGGIQIRNFDPDWALPTFRLLRIVTIVFAVIIAFPHIPGSGSNAFKGISVFMGLVLSLGSTSFIANLVAGYSMAYRRAFRRKDFIQVGEVQGFVEEQEVLVTRLRTIKNEEVVIPNSTLLNSNIMNFSTKAKENDLILHTTVGIGYETPWRMVDAMLILAAARTPGLLKTPAPFILKTQLGDYAITYELNVYCSDASLIPVCYSDLHQNILDVFNENNVQIMTPSYVLDPEKPKVVPKDQWNIPLANT